MASGPGRAGTGSAARQGGRPLPQAAAAAAVGGGSAHTVMMAPRGARICKYPNHLACAFRRTAGVEPAILPGSRTPRFSALPSRKARRHTLWNILAHRSEGSPITSMSGLAGIGYQKMAWNARKKSCELSSVKKAGPGNRSQASFFLILLVSPQAAGAPSPGFRHRAGSHAGPAAPPSHPGRGSPAR